MQVPQQHPLPLPHPSLAGPGVGGRGAPLGQRQRPAPCPGGVRVSPRCLLEHRAARQPCPAPGQGEHGPGRGLPGWRGSRSQLVTLVLSQEQELQGEIAALRVQLSEREEALQSTAQQLRSTAQLKDSMERFIVSQRRWPGQAGLVPTRLGWLHSGDLADPISLSLSLSQ